MERQLIIDSYGVFKPAIVSEAVYDDHNNMIRGLLLQGILQRANAINQNGRKYPRLILRREADKYKKVFVTEKRSYGELDHPDSSVVSMQTASHWVVDLWWEGDDLWGKVELLDTPCGRIVEAIVRRGLTIGISSRGLGSVKPLREDSDEVEVQDDFEILAWDFVSNPSTQGAFMHQVKEQIYEGYTKNNAGIYVPNYKYGRVNQLINDILLDI